MLSYRLKSLFIYSKNKQSKDEGLKPSKEELRKKRAREDAKKSRQRVKDRLEELERVSGLLIIVWNYHLSYHIQNTYICKS